MAKDDVKFSINLDSPIAVYVQIENLVQFAMASGKLAPGDTLPSVRDMSAMLEINPNTVTKAYRDLELMQLVHTRRGVGVTVSKAAPGLCKKRIHTMVKAHLRDAVAECVASGISAADIKKGAKEAIDSKASPYEV
ncbi:MAG: GntR family transcriptional regulator [Candidatus Hydrogenedentes bacterium]|nr:GntR family transcriptional regulator [Candidatus Hydrogenedentota bacterium]